MRQPCPYTHEPDKNCWNCYNTGWVNDSFGGSTFGQPPVRPQKEDPPPRQEPPKRPDPPRNPPKQPPKQPQGTSSSSGGALKGIGLIVVILALVGLFGNKDGTQDQGASPGGGSVPGDTRKPPPSPSPVFGGSSSPSSRTNTGPTPIVTPETPSTPALPPTFPPTETAPLLSSNRSQSYGLQDKDGFIYYIERKVNTPISHIEYWAKDWQFYAVTLDGRRHPLRERNVGWGLNYWITNHQNQLKAFELADARDPDNPNTALGWRIRLPLYLEPTTPDGKNRNVNINVVETPRRAPSTPFDRPDLGDALLAEERWTLWTGGGLDCVQIRVEGPIKFSVKQVEYWSEKRLLVVVTPDGGHYPLDMRMNDRTHEHLDGRYSSIEFVSVDNRDDEHSPVRSRIKVLLYY